jgi:hypothetical protein
VPIRPLQIAANIGNRHALAGLSHPRVLLGLDSMFLFCSRSCQSQTDSSEH